jgi:hypothetical protein
VAAATVLEVPAVVKAETAAMTAPALVTMTVLEVAVVEVEKETGNS